MIRFASKAFLRFSVSEDINNSIKRCTVIACNVQLIVILQITYSLRQIQIVFIRLQIFNVKVGRFLLVTHCRCPYNCLVTKLVVHFVTFFLLCVKYLVCFMNIIIVRDRIKYSVFAHVSNNREHVSPYVQICIQHGYFIAAENYNSGQKIFITIILCILLNNIIKV